MMSRLPARQWIASVMVFCALLLSILACGGPSHPENIPMATLEPNFPPVHVITYVEGTLQSRTGRAGAVQWSTHFNASRQALLTASVDSQTVYLSADQSPLLSAVNARDGHIVWQFSTCAEPDTRVFQRQDMLFVTCGQADSVGPVDIPLATVYALDARTGGMLWKRPKQHAQAIVGDHLIVQTTAGVAALSVKTGQTSWEHQVDSTPDSPNPEDFDPFHFVVVVGPAGIYYSPDGVYAEALRASDGARLWRTGKLQDTSSAPNDTFNQHTVIAVATASVVMTQGKYGVTALRPSDGKTLWTYYRYPDGGGVSAAVDKDGTVYTAMYASPSIPNPLDKDIDALAALNPRDGAVLWRIPQRGTSDNHPTLVVEGDTLVILGATTALNAKDGTIGWQWNYVFGVEFVVMTSNVVVFQTTSAFYLLKSTDGYMVWKVAISTSRETAPLVLPA